MKNSNTGDKGAAGQSPLHCGALAAVNRKLWMSQAGGKGGGEHSKQLLHRTTRLQSPHEEGTWPAHTCVPDPCRSQEESTGRPGR